MDKTGKENGEMEKVVQGYFLTKTGTSYQRLVMVNYNKTKP